MNAPMSCKRRADPVGHLSQSVYTTYTRGRKPTNQWL